MNLFYQTMKVLFCATCLVLSCLALPHTVYGQAVQDKPLIIPPSPNAMAFQRYGAIPVNYYNGVAQVSVPLLDVKSKDVSFPVSLSYHGSGIKVTDDASKVGLGWVLNAGGIITRSIVGQDDFGEGSKQKYHSTEEPELIQGSMAQTQYNVQQCEVTMFDQTRTYHTYDAEPDQYTYSLPNGKSGKFILKRNKQVVLAKDEKIDIKVLDLTGSQWTIRTDDGFMYEFFKSEFYYGNEFTGSAGQFKTAWYLTKIISPKGNIVTFEYDERANYVSSGGRNRYSLSGATVGYFKEGNEYFLANECDAPLAPIAESVPGRQYKNIQLDKIVFNEGYVKFIYNDRLDVQHDQKLDRVELFEKIKGAPTSLPVSVRALDFEYGYFEAEQGPQTVLYGVTKRLKLKRVYDKSKNNETGYHYKFDYIKEYDNKSFLPNKLSLAQDHWGYYNGRHNNTSLIPTYGTLATGDKGRDYIGSMNDERDPSTSDHASLFALKKIWYPTGGYSEFDYEAHTYDRLNSIEKDGSFFAWTVDTNIAEGPAQFTIDGDTPGVYPASFAQAQTANMVLDLTNAIATSHNGVPGNVVVGFKTFFLFNSYQSSCSFPGHSLTYQIVAENGTVHYTADIFQLLNESVNPAYCVTSGSSYHGIQRDGSLGLPKGKYYFRVNIPSGENLFSIIKPTFSFRVPSSGANPNTLAEIGGGIRIKRISNYEAPSAVPEITRFVYDYQLDKNNDGTPENYSFGRRSGRPEYSYFDYRLVKKYDMQNIEHKYICETVKRDGDGIMSLSASGSPVSYDKVTVMYGENGENGKTEYEYYNVSPTVLSYTQWAYLGAAATVPRRPPAVTSFFDPMNGSLQTQIDYRYVSPGQFQCVKKVEHEYANSKPFQTAITWGAETRSVAAASLVECTKMTVVYPVHRAAWVNLAKTTETIYDQTDVNKWFRSIKTFAYGTNHLQLTSTVETIGEKTITKTFKYPLDYSETDASPGIKRLRADSVFMHSSLVEAKATQKINGVDKVLSHDIQLFGIVSDKVFPTSSLSFRLDKPEDPANVPNYIPATTPDNTKYKTNFTTNYNAAREVSSVEKPNDIKVSYLWGYQKRLPIAEVTNSKPEDAFYTSFEDFGEGNSSDAKSGKSSITGGYSKPLTGLTIGDYLLTYWQKNGANWDFVSQNVTLSSSSYTITLTGQVDEVRFYPAAAQMKTFTYSPLSGITETIDANNMITRFEYDPFNRLHMIKDHNGNIIKRYTYYYKVK